MYLRSPSQLWRHKMWISTRPIKRLQMFMCFTKIYQQCNHVKKSWKDSMRTSSSMRNMIKQSWLLCKRGLASKVCYKPEKNYGFKNLSIWAFLSNAFFTVYSPSEVIKDLQSKVNDLEVRLKGASSRLYDTPINTNKRSRAEYDDEEVDESKVCTFEFPHLPFNLTSDQYKIFLYP